MPVSSVAMMLQDPLYYEIARNALEQQAFEYESEEARRLLEQLELEEEFGGEEEGFGGEEGGFGE